MHLHLQEVRADLHRPFGDLPLHGGLDPGEGDTQAVDHPGHQNSIEISAKAGINIKKIVSAEISSKYSHGWTESATFGLDIEETVPAYTTKVFYSQNPVHRHNGDFTVRLGNTTWVLKDVYFDQPDKDRQPNQGSYNIPAPGTPTSA